MMKQEKLVCIEREQDLKTKKSLKKNIIISERIVLNRQLINIKKIH